MKKKGKNSKKNFIRFDYNNMKERTAAHINTYTIRPSATGKMMKNKWFVFVRNMGHVEKSINLINLMTKAIFLKPCFA